MRTRFAILSWLTAVAAIGATSPLPSPMPKVHDERVQLQLFAADPAIVTPIGMAIDSRDRIFVVESHTHGPPKDYPGPKTDRIKVFEDADRDGRPERIEVFAEGFKDAMNLAFGPDGALYLACAREVWALTVSDGEPTPSRRRILELKTSNMHSHSALLGITFGPDGWLYASRGNNGSAAYTLEGADGSSVSGYGDGGNVVRCRPDGSMLEEFATGFWNPFDLKFDSRGRLLCVDNDPDARGPNRLLHIVAHGDYGYKSLYGGGGNHPFQAWEGEMPGTLPMIDGTGEAPSGLIDCINAALPPDYAGDLLVTIWNENTITRYKTAKQGVSLSATHSALISGGQDFRPVALAADSTGAIYVTDWVLVDYPNHGRGRIWKIAAKSNQPLNKPRARFAKPDKEPGVEKLGAVFRIADGRDYPRLEAALQSTDAFMRHAAVVALSRPALRKQALAGASHPDPAIRLGALLALRRAGITNAEVLIRDWLNDSSVDVRRMALVWAGEAMLGNLRDSLADALRGDNVSATLFETYFAAVACLDPDYIRARRSRARDKANQLQRPLPAGLLDAIVADTNRPARVRALAMTRFGTGGPESRFRLVADLAVKAEPILQKEALRTLARMNHPEAAYIIGAVAMDPAQTSSGRAEALLALGGHTVTNPMPFLKLIDDRDAVVRTEVLRLLRPHAGDKAVRSALERKLASIHHDTNQAAFREQLGYALFPPGSDAPAHVLPRPASPEQWLKALENGGDPVAGERVFFSVSTSCSLCHTIQNRGGKLGPDLSNIGQSVNRSQIINSILRPSEQFPPQYQAWFIRTKDGETHQGLQLDHESGGALELFTAAGKFEYFAAKDIESYGVLPQSLMPERLEEAMTVTELRDLVAFLEAAK